MSKFDRSPKASPLPPAASPAQGTALAYTLWTAPIGTCSNEAFVFLKAAEGVLESAHRSFVLDPTRGQAFRVPITASVLSAPIGS